MKKIIFICFICLFLMFISKGAITASESVKHQFDITDPNVTFFYPKSDEGHVATAPFYFVYTTDPNSNTKQGTAYWTPNEGDEGTYNVQFKATDSKGAVATKIVTFIVKPKNRPPSLYVGKENKNVHSKSKILQ